MANVTGIDINPILQQLNGTSNYHPFDAETFSDWATEAGDIVTISRNGESYSSPIHTSRMVWKGKAPTMRISTTGNEKRDAVSRVSRKKYGRGSAGIRSQEGIHRDFTSEDGILHSELHMTESYMRTEFHDETNSLRSYFDMTASHMRTEFLDEVHSLRGEFEVTASHLRTEFTDEVHSLRGEFEVTASHLRTEFEDDVNSLRGEFEVTASHLRTEFEDDVNSVRSYMHQTASSWEARVEGVTDANGNITAASIALAVNSAGSEARINADRIYLLGQTIADTIDANYIYTKIQSISTLLANKIDATEIQAGDIKISPIPGMGALSVGAAYSGSNLTRTGDTYKLTLVKLNGQFDEWTFSRATTLSGAWSGRRFTVTASPQGNESYTELWSAVPAANVTWDGTIATLNLYATLNGGETTYNAGPVTVNIASFLQDKTGATKKFTANGLYSADSGYVGFGNIEIDVPQSTVDPTTLSIQWNGSRRLNANANPQGVSRYTTIVSSIPNSDITFSGTTLTLPLKATYDDGETTVAVGNVTANISGKLQTKTISENGTVTPDAGYIGFGSVTVAVPTTNASARFGVAEGSYFIEAYDRTSGTSITGSSVTYKLAKSGNKVQIQNTSSVQLSSTPEYDMSTDLTNAGYSGRAAVTLNDPTWNPVTGETPYYRTVTVTTAGRTNANGTTDNLSKSVALYLTQGSWSSNTLTVFMRTGGTSGTVYASTTVDASSIYTNGQENGWTGYWNRLQYPKAKTNAGTANAACMTAYYPNGTYNSAYDSVAKVYTISSGDNTAYIKDASGHVMAEITHNKYTNGMADGNTAAGVTASWNGNVYTVERAANTTTKKYTCTVTVNTPSFTYNTSTHKYTATAIAYGNAEARQTKTNDSGTEAYDAGYDANNSAWLYEQSTGNIAGNLNPGIWVTAGYRDHNNTLHYCGSRWYTLKAGGVREHTGTEPSGLTPLAANKVYEVYYSNGSGGTPGAGIYFKTPSGGSSYSHNVTLTRYRAGAVEGSYAGQMYRRNANGSYQALGSSTSMWYECKTNLGSSKTVYYN